jgi:oxygen-dependent protoporphyrinogen oxidase
MAKICIIGAGISGLASAWQLHQAGNDCTVLEAGERIGGSIRSHQREGFLMEAGPNSIQINSAEIAAFLDSIPNLKGQIIESETAAKKRFLVRAGRVFSVPMGPLQALTTPLFSLGAKLRLLKEPFIKPALDECEESVADFVRRRLGDEFYNYAIDPLVGGIYAGRPETLSLRYAFPKLYALEQKDGGLIRGALKKIFNADTKKNKSFKKSIISFQEGLETLPNYIAKALGDRVQTSVNLESIKKENNKWLVACNGKTELYDTVILTVPAHSLKNLPLDQALSKALEPLDTIEYPPVSVLSLGFKRNAIEHPLDGFGVLVPSCEERSILGALFPSSFFKNRAPKDQVLLTIFVGGDRQPELCNPELETLTKLVIPELETLLGVKEPPTICQLDHWPRAIPQYKIGYGKYLKSIQTIEAAHSGLKIAGNYRDGISLSYCLEAAIKARP